LKAKKLRKEKRPAGSIYKKPSVSSKSPPSSFSHEYNSSSQSPASSYAQQTAPQAPTPPEIPAPQHEVIDISLPILVILTLLVPGFGHWLMRSRHAISYLALAIFVWFLTLSAILAFSFQLFSALFLMLPLAYHFIAAHDVVVEYKGLEFKRWLHILF
jgi:hypothetical protein